MQGFKKLLESVRSINPDLISEEAATQMLGEYESGINQIKSDALAEGQALGFKEGYDEGKRIAADEAKKSMDALTEQLDQEATEKLKSVLDMLTEQHAEKLQEVYDMLKEQYVPKAEFDQLDADSAQKLQEVYESCCKKAEAEKEAAVKETTDKMNLKMEEREKFLAKKHKAVKILLESKISEATKALAEEKERKTEILAEQVEKYINYALADKIPVKQLISEQKYQASQKAIEKITGILKINNILQESKDGIFMDYENTIKNQKEETNKLLVENASLKSQINKQEAKLLLEEKLRKCVPAEASFLRNYFKSADSKQIIEEQIEEARAVYKRLYDEKRKALVAENAKKVSVKPSTVVVAESKEAVKKEEPKKQVVTESVKPEETAKTPYTKATFASVYSDMLKADK